jgi:putative oxidoreductase
MKSMIKWLVEWPRGVAGHLGWLAPLFARITVGWVFLLSGWGKLHNLPQVTENFIGWGIPFPHFFTPLTSGIEFFGGLFLLLGLLTRISAGALGITMIVAIKAAKWGDVDSLVNSNILRCSCGLLSPDLAFCPSIIGCCADSEGRPLNWWRTIRLSRFYLPSGFHDCARRASTDS